MPPAPVVVLHLWGVRPRHVPSALGRMALDHVLMRARPPAGLTFSKLLGTGDGRSFTARDADPLHWGLLTCWTPPAATGDGDGTQDGTDEVLRRCGATPTVRGWDALAHERLRVVMRPTVSRGRWSGREPFGDPSPRPTRGPVASITRARLRVATARTFWRSVPPVSADLRQVDGLRLAVGVGEAPVGLQGTFSLWDDSRSLVAFAHGRRPHQEVVRRTGELDWYAEELFARFEVLRVDGTYGGRAP